MATKKEHMRLQKQKERQESIKGKTDASAAEQPIFTTPLNDMNVLGLAPASSVITPNPMPEHKPSAAETAPAASATPPAPESAKAPEPAAAAPTLENAPWEKEREVFTAPKAASFAATEQQTQTLPVSMQQPEEKKNFVVEPDPAQIEKATPTAPAVPLENKMYIAMVTPEVAPCAKVGGLGDVIQGLGHEMLKRGHGVEVFCPMYSCMRYDMIENLHEVYSELWCPHFGEWRAEKVFQGTVGGIQVNFITGGNYTQREKIYGYDDDLMRFTYFSRQALEFMYKTNRRPDIIHCHDWAVGLTPAIYWDIYEKLGWNNTRFCYTIHNVECQGLCHYSDRLLGLVGLDSRKYHTPDKMQDDNRGNCINMMKAGVVFSNFVTTVSPSYAGEIKSALGGQGLQNTFCKNSAKLGGVLNGIDYDLWNPRTDNKIAARFSDGDDYFEKYKNKKALREWLGLYDAWRPIVSVVTRLTAQKGLDLIKGAIFRTLEMDGQFILLGSAPDPRINNDFLRLQHELRDNHNVNLYIGYHEDLSRLIYAGSDMFLVPSLFEPCGLTQMISLRYGTVPIVRETGGLKDSVFDLDNSGKGLNDANGFTFRDANYESLCYGLDRAIRLWFDNPDAFNRLSRNGMRYDYSWRQPAGHYENIYNYIKA